MRNRNPAAGPLFAIVLAMLDGAGCAASSDDPAAAENSSNPPVTAWCPGGPGAIDPRDKGAMGNGRTDDTDAIQAAVDAAGRGGAVCMSPGVYLIRASHDTAAHGILLKSNLLFEMAPGTILRAMPTASDWSAILRVQGGSNITIRGGVLEGERDRHLSTDGEHGFGVALLGASRIVVEDVIARDLWGDGFYVGTARFDNDRGRAGCRDVRFTRVQGLRNRRQGLSIVDCTGAIVEDSAFSDTGGTAPGGGVDLEPNPGTRVENVTIGGCTMARNVFGVLIAGGGAEFGMNHRNRILANTIIGNAVNGISLVAVEDNEVRGNHVESSGVAGVQLFRTLDTVVVDNDIHASGRNGVELIASSTNRVADNRIEGCGVEAAGMWDGIRLVDRSSDNVIESNVVRAGAASPRFGVRIEDASCFHNQLIGNDLSASGISGGLSDQGTDTVSMDNRP